MTHAAAPSENFTSVSASVPSVQAVMIFVQVALQQRQHHLRSPGRRSGSCTR